MKSYPAKNSVALFLLFICGFLVYGQTSVVNTTAQAHPPAVFQLGEYDVQYEEMMPGYQTLLEACEGDMVEAYGKLTAMMQEMEAYAELSDYDLKGINAWMHFFWNKNGSISHIGFHLKPSSKNVDTDELKDFLTGFASNYRLPLTSELQFSHYSSFSFPLTFHSKINGTARN
jgi:hypothetical protein